MERNELGAMAAALSPLGLSRVVASRGLAYLGPAGPRRAGARAA